MGDFTVNVRQKPMDFNRWQLGLPSKVIMPPTPLTRITLVLPIPRSPEHNRDLRRILNELVLFCKGVTFSPTENPFFGIWEEDVGKNEDAQRILIIADAPNLINDPLLVAYLEYMKLRTQRIFGEQIIWLTVHRIDRISAHDYDFIPPDDERDEFNVQ
jgi:hypothetical protein